MQRMYWNNISTSQGTPNITGKPPESRESKDGIFL
jgi:hypothetical protein